ACAEQRQGGEQSKVSRRLGVHSRPRMEGSAHLSPICELSRWCATRLLLRTLTDEFAFRRISRIDVRVLPIQIEHRCRQYPLAPRWQVDPGVTGGHTMSERAVERHSRRWHPGHRVLFDPGPLSGD